METSVRPGTSANLPFDGKNSKLLDTWICKGCGKKPNEDGTGLLRCSRCKIVRYCSEKCQRNDFSDHSEVCKVISSLSLDLYCEALGLRSSSLVNQEHGQIKQNIFTSCAGMFWEIPQARDYCTIRYRLANVLGGIAEEYEVRPLLKSICLHRLELLRLIACDDTEQRFVVPFTLLRLNRDNDCYGFLKYWMSILTTGIYSPRRHQKSSRGEWIYLKDQDRTEDVLDVLEPKTDDMPLAFFAALCIIKLRIIATHEARLQQLKVFAKSQAGRLLGDCIVHVQTAYVGDKTNFKMIEHQKKHVNLYFGLMQKSNPTFLPSIVNPGPLMNQEHSCTWAHGMPSEAYSVHYDCYHLFSRIPGAMKRIEAVVGKNPTYNNNLRQMHKNCCC